MPFSNWHVRTVQIERLSHELKVRSWLPYWSAASKAVPITPTMLVARAMLAQVRPGAGGEFVDRCREISAFAATLPIRRKLPEMAARGSPRGLIVGRLGHNDNVGRGQHASTLRSKSSLNHHASVP